MTRSMLIDATQPEETRVAVLENDVLEEYDVESQAKPSLKGNIYVAKIMRIEPSLQAAFVDFGGNRHGFLPLSEVHPDYFQIPEEDQAELKRLQEEERLEAARREQEQEEEPDEDLDEADNAEASEESEEEEEHPSEPEQDAPEIEVEFYQDDQKSSDREENPDEDIKALSVDSEDSISEEIDDQETSSEDEPKEESSEEGEESEEGKRHHKKHSGRNQYGRVSKLTQFIRQYRIQEVLRKNQVILIQVVKEERGTKGAALTTYMSLPGRYCVLMPNTLKSGGVSRRISSEEDRTRLRNLIDGLKLPPTMAMIVRTAGGGRPDKEILKDCEYLLGLWHSVREKALEAVPPSLVHEEASLLKRAVRDLVTPDMDQIIIESSTQDRRDLKEYANQLMDNPSFEIKPWRNHGKSLFAHYGIEEHLENIVSPIAQLPSGGYLVINQTEALVAVDVNSGKSTNQRDVEATAYRTNLEAAEEVARQLRLRDLAGLIVIDFIDMSRPRHNHQVERALRDALRSDRARIQTGHISSFGLMEMSRQRLRPSLSESVSMPCAHCAGTGITRSIDNMSVSVLRKIESTASANRGKHISVALPGEMSFYLLNHKRHAIELLEKRTGCRIEFTLLPANETFTTTNLNIEVDKANKERTHDHGNDDSSEKHNHRNNKNRRRPDRNKDHRRNSEQSEESVDEAEKEEAPVEKENLAPGKKRTRTTRRKNGEKPVTSEVTEDTAVAEEAPTEKPQRRTRKKPAKSHAKDSEDKTTEATSAEKVEEKPKRRSRSSETDEAKAEKEPTKKRAPAKRKPAKVKPTAPTPVNVDDVKPSDEKKGWWDR